MRELRKLGYVRASVISIVVGAFGMVDKALIKKIPGGNENWKKNRNNQDYSIVMIGQKFEKNPGNLRKLAVN